MSRGHPKSNWHRQWVWGGGGGGALCLPRGGGGVEKKGCYPTITLPLWQGTGGGEEFRAMRRGVPMPWCSKSMMNPSTFAPSTVAVTCRGEGHTTKTQRHTEQNGRGTGAYGCPPDPHHTEMM